MAGDKPENPQVFPELERLKAGDVERVTVIEKGMTLRDYAVVHFMAAQMGMLTAENLATMATPMKRVRQVIFQSANAYADTMLEEREK